MGVPLVTDLTITSPREQEIEEQDLQVLSGSPIFWMMCGVGMTILTHFAWLGLKFLIVDEDTSERTRWVFCICLIIGFTLIEYLMFVFVSDIVQLQVANTRQNEDMTH